MLIKYFNSNRPGIFLLSPFVALVLWFHTFLKPQQLILSENVSAGPFGRYLDGLISGIPLLSAIIAVILVFFYGQLLVSLNIKFFFLETRSQLPRLFYITICGILALLRFFSPALAAVFLIILIIYRLFGTYKTEKLSLHFFDAGFLLSLATLIYLPSVFFFPLILLALFYFRASYWQEWTYPFIGFSIPVIFWASYLFWTDQNIGLIFQEFSHLFQHARLKATYSLIQLIFYAYLGFLILISSIHMMFIIGGRKIQSRVFLIFFFWIFIIGLILIFLVPSSGIEAIYFAGIPVAFLLSNYFTTCRNSRINNMLIGFLILMLAAIVINDWIDFVPQVYSF